jgi:hypothetical protein
MFCALFWRQPVHSPSELEGLVDVQHGQTIRQDLLAWNGT